MERSKEFTKFPGRPKVEDLIDGKVNWRGWLPNPNGFSTETQGLLDTMANFPELVNDLRVAEGIEPSDDLEKLDIFKSRALAKGLITKDEWLQIQMEKHKTV